jgi:hypothetical protein
MAQTEEANNKQQIASSKKQKAKRLGSIRHAPIEVRFLSAP